MNGQGGLNKYINESMNRYISLMFSEASEYVQDQIFALLEDDIGTERREELWRQARLDMDQGIESLRDSENNNKNKE